MNMTCINCPMGCQLTVEQQGDNIIVTGNTCARGEAYGKQEFIAPKRMVTTLIRLNNGGVVSCKTSDFIPKDKIFPCLQEVEKTIATVPVSIGDVLISNVLGLGVDIVATKNISK